MAAAKDPQASRSRGRRQRTTVALDHVLAREAMREIGATSIADAVEAGLKALVRPRAVALADSGDPYLAEHVDDALRQGFGRG